MTEEKEKKSSWWKYAVGAYAADKAIDSKIEREVDRRVRERLDELEEESKEREKSGKIKELKQTPKGRQLLISVQKSKKFIEENSDKFERLKEEKEKTSNLIRICENKINYNARVSGWMAVLLDIITLGGSRYLYLKAELSEKVDIGNKKEHLLSNTNLGGIWFIKIIMGIIMISILLYANFDDIEGKLGFLGAFFIFIIWNLTNTYKIAGSLNDNYNNFEGNKKELPKAKKHATDAKNEYEKLEKIFVNTEKALDEFDNYLEE